MKNVRVWLLILAAIAIVEPLVAQDTNAPQPETGNITGTVTDVNGDTLSGAIVVLQGHGLKEPRKVLSDDNGFFEFKQLDPGTYRVTITAQDFADWISPDLVLNPGQYLILTDGKLHIPKAMTTVRVARSPEEVATEQVKIEETQRIFGIIPNFYVVYEPNPVPLTTKLKFRLALKVAIDPITFVGIAFLSGVQQAGDTPDYGQGAQGFAKRFGANTADAFTNIMIGGAILPSLLHQDPRYFYQGTGTNKSRIRHAVLSPFVCKGDNGKWQPNYSSLGGDLASSAISNAYYPESNRGAGLVFTNFALSTGERMAATLAQEFFLHKLTRQHRDSKK